MSNKNDSLNVLIALANISVDQCSVKKTDGDAEVSIVSDASVNIPPMAVSLKLLNAAYIGTVKLWPMIKSIKDDIHAEAKAKADADKVAAREAKLKAKADEVAARKAQREAEKATRDAQRLAEKTAKAEARAKAAADKLAAKEEARKAKEDAKAKAAEQKRIADEAKKASDAAKLKAAAEKLDQATKHPAVVKDAGAKAVAAVKASKPAPQSVKVIAPAKAAKK